MAIYFCCPSENPLSRGSTVPICSSYSAQEECEVTEEYSLRTGQVKKWVVMAPVVR